MLELIEAAQLKQRGVNYRTAERVGLELTEEEAVQIAQAIELVNALQASGASQPSEKSSFPSCEVGGEIIEETADSNEGAGASDEPSARDLAANDQAPAAEAASRSQPKKRRRR